MARRILVLAGMEYSIRAALPEIPDTRRRGLQAVRLVFVEQLNKTRKYYSATLPWHSDRC